MRSGAEFNAFYLVQVLGRVDIIVALAQEEDKVAFFPEVQGHLILYRLQQSYHANGRGGIRMERKWKVRKRGAEADRGVYMWLGFSWGVFSMGSTVTVRRME